VATAPGPAWPLLALVTALVPVLLSFIGINRQMWIDEHVTYYVTELTWSQFWNLIGNQDLVHGAYYVLMRLWTDIAGTSLVALRLPSIIGMAITAGGLTLLGRRLFSTRVGLLAGLVFGVLPTVSRYGQEVRSYALVSALVVLATLALTYAITLPDGPRWTLYTVSMIAVTYLHVVAALILLPHFLLVLHALRREREKAIAWWFLSAAAIGVAALPLLYYARGQSAQVDWITADADAVRRYPVELFGSDLVTAAVVLLGLVGAVQLARQRAGNMVAVLVWAVVPPAFSYLTFDLVHLFLAKYALFVLPAWALLVGGVLGVPKPSPPAAAPENAQPWAAPTRKRWLGRTAAVFLVLVPLAVAAVGYPAHQDLRRDPVATEPDFRAAAAVVDDGFQDGDGIVYAGTYRWARLPFRYELQRATPKDVFVEVTPDDNGWFYPQECKDPAACLGETARLWLVVTNYSGDDWTGVPEAQAKLLQRDFEVSTTTPLDNARVVLLVRKRS
jgi:mannosyltransferase